MTGTRPGPLSERAMGKSSAGVGLRDRILFPSQRLGMRYASELVTAALNLADRKLRLPEVRAFAHCEPAPNIHPLETASNMLI